MTAEEFKNLHGLTNQRLQPTRNAIDRAVERDKDGFGGCVKDQPWPRGPRAKRFSDALAISDGACNPSGIAISFTQGCQEARTEGMDTAALRADPALRLMAYQLAFIMGAAEIDRSLYLFSKLRDQCKQKAKE